LLRSDKSNINLSARRREQFKVFWAISFVAELPQNLEVF